MSNPNDHLQDDPTPQGASAFSTELQDLLDGRLDDDAAAALRARIEREPALREEWGELRGIQRFVRGYGPQGAELEPPADFLAGVQARVAALKTREAIANERLDDPRRAPGNASRAGTPAPRRSGRMLRMLTVTYAAVALLVVGFTVRYVVDTPAPAGDATSGGGASTTAAVKPPKAGDISADDISADDLAPPVAEAGALPEGGSLQDDEPKKAVLPEDRLLRLQKEEAAKRAEGLAREAGKAMASGDDTSGGRSPKPEARESLRPKDGRGGFFGSPGGAVTPGVRPPPGSKAKKPDGGLGASDAGKDREQPAAAKTSPGPTTPSDGLASGRAGRLASLEQSLSDGAIVYVLEVDDATTARRELALLLRGRGAHAKNFDLKRRGEKDAGEKIGDPNEAGSEGSGSIGRGGGAGGKVRKRGGNRAGSSRAGGSQAGTGAAEKKSEHDDDGKKQGGSAPRTLVYRPDAARLRTLLAQLRAPAPAKQPRSAGRASKLALVDVVTPALTAEALRRLEAAAVVGTWSRAAPASEARVRRSADKKAAKEDREPAAPAAPPAPGSVAPAPRSKAPTAATPPAPARKAPAQKAKAAPQIRILLVERKR